MVPPSFLATAYQAGGRGGNSFVTRLRVEFGCCVGFPRLPTATVRRQFAIHCSVIAELNVVALRLIVASTVKLPFYNGIRQQQQLHLLSKAFHVEVGKF